MTRLAPGSGTGPTVAVKDLIDLAGEPTSAGCLAVARAARPSAGDAACLAGVRAAGGRFVGKTALHELAFGVSGENPWYGTPVNPIDPTRMPGGSSSGSAVAVALGEADFAIGTDTGGSIRIPAACCGVVGLKTTHGAIALDGVRPLAPSFDTVGPLAADVAGAALGYGLLGGAPSVGAGPGVRAGRLRGLEDVDEAVDSAVDAALSAAEVPVEDVVLEGWPAAFRAHRVALGAEAWRSDGYLLSGTTETGVGEEVAGKLRIGASVTDDALEAALGTARSWRSELIRLLDRVGVLALPTIPCPPPLLGESPQRLVWLTAPVNLAGLPALSIPVPGAAGGAPLPASLQLVGLPGSETWLLELGGRVEAAVADLW